jgi:sugar phosphate isomerase/epimerase
VAWIPHEGPFNLETTRQAAADFDRAGRHLRERYGLTFCYHNHGYEFIPHGNGTLWDVLMAETDPQNVAVELDLLWVQHPGADPVAILDRLGNRVKLLHLKDLRRGVRGDFSGGTPVENDVALGTGQIDLPAVLAAARRAGVEHYYIEDESPSIGTQVPQSIAYLRSLTFGDVRARP